MTLAEKYSTLHLVHYNLDQTCMNGRFLRSWKVPDTLCYDIIVLSSFAIRVISHHFLANDA